MNIFLMKNFQLQQYVLNYQKNIYSLQMKLKKRIKNF